MRRRKTDGSKVTNFINLLADVFLAGYGDSEKETSAFDMTAVLDNILPLTDSKKIAKVICLCEKLLDPREALIIRNRYGFNRSGRCLTYEEIRVILLERFIGNISVTHKNALHKLFWLGYRREEWFYKLYRSGQKIHLELQRQKYAFENLTGEDLKKALSETKVQDFRDYALFSSRVRNIFESIGFNRLVDIVSGSKRNLFEWKQVGIKTLEEIENILSKSNLHLGMFDDI